eukprot:1254445-Rhodomonas_salina.3
MIGGVVDRLLEIRRADRRNSWRSSWAQARTEQTSAVNDAVLGNLDALHHLQQHAHRTSAPKARCSCSSEEVSDVLLASGAWGSGVEGLGWRGLRGRYLVFGEDSATNYAVLDRPRHLNADKRVKKEVNTVECGGFTA